MSAAEQEHRGSGSVPNAYRNALFWRWAPAMPSALPTAFVNLLYACGAAADPAGKLKFRDGKPIRVKDIAAGAKADEKDVRRYLEAGVAAGVLARNGERRRGRVVLYALVLSPAPDWGAALASLQGTKRKRATGRPEVRKDAGERGPAPVLDTQEEQGPAPVLSPESKRSERGPTPDRERGPAPDQNGGPPPNNPSNSQEVPHDLVPSVTQPPVGTNAPHENDHSAAADPQQADARASPPDAAQPDAGGWTRCTRCHGPLLHRTDGRDTHAYCEPRIATKGAKPA